MKDDTSVSELASWVGDSDIEQNKEFSKVNIEVKIQFPFSHIRFEAPVRHLRETEP